MKFRTTGVSALIGIAVLCVAVVAAGASLAQDDLARTVNEAVPIPKSIQFTWEKLRASASETDRAQLDREFTAHLAVRGLSCAVTYLTSSLKDAAEAGKKLAGSVCMEQADATLLAWIELRRVAVMLTLPPLRPSPETIPEIISANHPNTVRFSRNAGVMVLLGIGLGKLEVVEIENGRRILTLDNPNIISVGELSPNGRLYTITQQFTMSICDSETGERIASLPVSNANEFLWLDDRTAFFAHGIMHKSMLIDFKTGLQKSAEGFQDPALHLAALKNGTYVGFSNTAATKFKLAYTNLEPEIIVIKQSPFFARNYTRNQDTLNSDETYFVHASGDVVITSTESLESRTDAVKPFSITSVTALADPDTVLISGSVPNSNTLGFDRFLYSISKDSYAIVSREQFRDAIYVKYVPGLNALALIGPQRVSFTKVLNPEKPMSLEAFNAWAENFLKERQAMAAAELEAARVQQAANPPVHSIHRYQIVDENGQLKFMPAGTEGGDKPIDSPVARLAKDATVEGVGVYQAANSETMPGQEQRRTGAIEVRVRKAAKPLVLVLSSYQSVHWKLVLEEGAKLEAVLTSGHHASDVQGAGVARVVSIGSLYSYQLGTLEYDALQREIVRWTGQKPVIFQVAYEGSKFQVGGDFAPTRGKK